MDNPGKMTRLIPKAPAQGEIIPQRPNSSEPTEIEYQPAHGRFFFPERLGFHIGEYVDFFEWTVNKHKYLCLISPGCPKTGRRVSPHCKQEKQRELREKGTARVHVTLPDFNEWYLGLPHPNDPNFPQAANYGRIYHGWATTFRERYRKEYSPIIRKGIIMDLTMERSLPGSYDMLMEPPKLLEAV